MVTESEAIKIFEDHFFVDDGGSYEFNTQTQSVDVQGDLRVHSAIHSMDKIPVKLGVVKGNVIFKHLGLKTLENSPRIITGFLNLGFNHLTSLAHAPDLVEEDFFVEQNQLTTLDCAHTTIQKDFKVSGNHLKNLNGCPEVGGMFVVSRNRDITDLSGVDKVNHIILTYNPQLPLLRLLEVKGQIIIAGTTESMHKVIKSIFEDPKYQGKGKSVALNVAMLLKKADFPPTNVRW